MSYGYFYCVQRKVNGCWIDAPGWLPDGTAFSTAMHLIELGKHDYQTYSWRVLWKNPAGDIEVKHEEHDTIRFMPWILIFFGIILLFYALTR